MSANSALFWIYNSSRYILGTEGLDCPVSVSYLRDGPLMPNQGEGPGKYIMKKKTKSVEELISTLEISGQNAHEQLLDAKEDFADLHGRLFELEHYIQEIRSIIVSLKKPKD